MKVTEIKIQSCDVDQMALYIGGKLATHKTVRHNTTDYDHWYDWYSGVLYGMKIGLVVEEKRIQLIRIKPYRWPQYLHKVLADFNLG